MGHPFVGHRFVGIRTDFHSTDRVGQCLFRVQCRVMVRSGCLVLVRIGSSMVIVMGVDMVMHVASSAPGVAGRIAHPE